MSTADYAWANIGPDAWLLVDGPSASTSGVIRAYLLGIYDDDWLWRGIGGEGRADSLERGMLEAQVSVMIAMGVDLYGDADDDAESDAEGGPDSPPGSDGFDAKTGGEEPDAAVGSVGSAAAAGTHVADAAAGTNGLDDSDDLIDRLLDPDG